MRYSFPITAVRNYHEFSGLKQHNLFILQFWRSKVWNEPYKAKIKVLAGLRPFWRCQQRIHFLDFFGF